MGEWSDLLSRRWRTPASNTALPKPSLQIKWSRTAPCTSPRSSWWQVKSTSNFSQDLNRPRSCIVPATILVWLVSLIKSALISPVHTRLSKSFFLIVSLTIPSISKSSFSSASGLLVSTGKYELISRVLDVLNLIIAACSRSDQVIHQLLHSW